MFCSKCGKENVEEAKFCVGCGAPMENNSSTKSKKTAKAKEEATVSQQQTVAQQPQIQYVNAFDPNNIPYEYRPISMWGYFGWELLFAIPCVGWILLLIFALGGTSNKNLRNFAASYFCIIFLALIVFIILTLLGFVGVASYINFAY